jgi:D-glycero-D-manno-heptose 1,7-bisphosphate phosphatase
MGIRRLKKTAFLDRDGVINNVIVKNNKVFSPRRFVEFTLTPNIARYIDRIKEAGYLVIVVTNQPDISRAKLNIHELEKMHNKIRNELDVDDIFVCPHDDSDNCVCRKPKPGMVIEAKKKYDIDLANSFLIGDSWKDIDAAKRSGCREILINASYNQDIDCVNRVNNLSEAISLITRIHEEVM